MPQNPFCLTLYKCLKPKSQNPTAIYSGILARVPQPCIILTFHIHMLSLNRTEQSETNFYRKNQKLYATPCLSTMKLIVASVFISYLCISKSGILIEEKKKKKSASIINLD